MHKHTQRTISIVALLALVFGINIGLVSTANAASITSAKDTISTVASAGLGTHAFSFTTATSLTATQTIILMFNEGTSDWTLDGTITAADFSGASGLAFVDNVGACTGAASEVFPTVTNGANDFYTLTVCTGDTVTAGAKTFTIDNNEITNPTTGSPATYVIDITTTSDTGSIAVAIVPDDSVNVTATVDPSITFSISDVAIGFGTLSTGAARYANGAATGSASVVSAHSLTAGTNATSGLVVTYNGALLTSGANNIDAATISGDADGTPGSEQFAISFDDNGTNFTMVSAYDEASNNSSYVASTTTTIFSSSAPVASTAVDSHYLANIAANTPAGSYQTDITYIATGTF